MHSLLKQHTAHAIWLMTDLNKALKFKKSIYSKLCKYEIPASGTEDLKSKLRITGPLLRESTGDRQ